MSTYFKFNSDKTKSERKEFITFLRVCFSQLTKIKILHRANKNSNRYIGMELQRLLLQVTSSIQLTTCSLVHAHIKGLSKLAEDFISFGVDVFIMTTLLFKADSF